MDSTPSSPTPSRPGTPLGELPNVPNATPRPFRFTWDPTASRRQGPGSVSATTEGRGDYFAQPPTLDLLASGPVQAGSLPREWSASTDGFHAISTVLNNPHKTQAPPKAHSSLPSITPADLPRVRRKDFDPYLRAITAEWSRYEKNASLGKEGVAQLDGPMSPQRPVFSFSPDPDGSRTPRPLTPVPGRSIPLLSSVPDVFFEDDFELGDARTFALVTEQPEHAESAFASSSDPASLSRSLPLLEKFSHYADTVEQHLVKEISLRSTSFFAALTNLHDLQAESEQCLTRTTKLRKLLVDVDDKGAKKGLELVRKQFKRQNLGKVQEGLKVVSTVVEMTSVARNLVTAGQWDEALDAIEEMDHLWGYTEAAKPELSDSRPRSNGISSIAEADEPSSSSVFSTASSSSSTPSISISSLNAFAALPTHLRTLTAEITSSLISELLQSLNDDLQDRIAQRTPKQSLNRTLRERLQPLLGSLSRTKGVKEAMRNWSEEVLQSTKEVVKSSLPMFDEADEPPPGTSDSSGPRPGLGNHLRSLTSSDFRDLMRSLYRQFLNGIEGIQLQTTICLEILQSSAPSDLDIDSLREDLSDTIASVAELTNSQAGHIVNLRFLDLYIFTAKIEPSPSALSLVEFDAFFKDCWDFVVKCEVLCRRMVVGLRGVAVGQAKAFLQAFHQDKIGKSAKAVEEEQWAPVEVGRAHQRVVDVLVEAAMSDAPELRLSSPFSEPTPSSPAANATSSKQLQIEERPFFVVKASLEVLGMIHGYLQVIVNLPTLTTETMSRVIEFLKAFNSRTCQVVLGAGAMRSAGLKNITAKHLALASQSLSIMTALIPYIREAFRRHLSSKQTVILVEFDKLKRDYQEHQNEIHSKLIAIMGDRLTAHIKTLQSVDWTPEEVSSDVNSYMTLLVKETVMLHKVLTRYLAQPIVEYVMTQVFAAITHRLSEEYGSIDLPHQAAKTRLSADAHYLHQSLSALKGVSLQNSMLEMVISEKRISSSPISTPQAQSSQKPTMASMVSRASTIGSANQRLKGLLSGRSSASTTNLALEKPLPAPSPPPFPAASPSMLNASPTPPAEFSRGPSPPVPMKSPLNGTSPLLPPSELQELQDHLRSPDPLPVLGPRRTSSYGFREVYADAESPRAEERVMSPVLNGNSSLRSDMPSGLSSPAQSRPGSRPNSPRPNSPRPRPVIGEDGGIPLGEYDAA